MVDRDVFDEWLRQRAASHGAERRTGTFTQFSRGDDGVAVITYTDGKSRSGETRQVRARMVIGADGALSPVARQCVPGAHKARHVFAYHEIVKSPVNDSQADFGAARCDVYYQAPLSPDFYAWVFPHGATTSIGTGTLQKGFGLKEAVAKLRHDTGLDQRGDDSPGGRADSRSSRFPAGTTAGTWCWRAMRPAWLRPPVARGSFMR